LAKTPEEKAAYQRQYRAKNRARLQAQSKARSAAWYQKNRERVLARQRAHRDSDPETARERSRRHALAYKARDPARASANRERWRKEHAEEERERLRAWRMKHPEECRVRVRRHRAKRLGGTGDHDASGVAARCALFGNRCAYCGGPREHIDHAEALAVSGNNSSSNLVPSCGACNRSKGRRGAREFIGLRVRLGRPITDAAYAYWRSDATEWHPAP
jgi:hypothetical protein